MTSLMQPKILGHLRALLMMHATSSTPQVMDEFFCSAKFAEFAQGFDRDLLALFQQFAAQHKELPVAAPTPAVNRIEKPIEKPVVQPMPAELVNSRSANIPPQRAVGELSLLQPPVARVGSHYQHQFLDHGRVRWLAIDLPVEIGLQVDLLNGQISGIPTQAAQYQVKLRYQLLHEAGLGAIRESVFPLLINVDPRSLWKNLPSDCEAAFWRPDNQAAYLPGPVLQVMAASKRGRSHAHVGSFRDDAMAFADNQVWQIAVMADGAGSARYSRRAAELICDVSAQELKSSLAGPIGQQLQAAASAGDAALLEQLAQNCLAQALRCAWQQIEQNCAQLQHLNPAPSLRDFCSTAMLLASCRLPQGLLCLSYWVGDGALVAILPAGQVRIFGQADAGEFAGQTRFLDATVLEGEALSTRVQCHVLPQVEAVLMMTDGVSDPHFDSDSEFQDPAHWHAFWQQLGTVLGWQTEPTEPTAQTDAAGELAAQRLLEWLDFWASGHHDDRSIAVLR